MQCTQVQTTIFQSTRLSRASTARLTSPTDRKWHFNPQGSHEPRPSISAMIVPLLKISIHKALTSLDVLCEVASDACLNFNPQGSHEPRRFNKPIIILCTNISIHKALTSLDSKNTQLSLYPCQIYIS